jgi:hypothetical protein
VAGERARSALLAHRLREREAVQRRLPRTEQHGEDLELKREQASRFAPRHATQE